MIARHIQTSQDLNSSQKTERNAITPGKIIAGSRNNMLMMLARIATEGDHMELLANQKLFEIAI